MLGTKNMIIIGLAIAAYYYFKQNSELKAEIKLSKGGKQ